MWIFDFPCLTWCFRSTFLWSPTWNPERLSSDLWNTGRLWFWSWMIGYGFTSWRNSCRCCDECGISGGAAKAPTTPKLDNNPVITSVFVNVWFIIIPPWLYLPDCRWKKSYKSLSITLINLVYVFSAKIASSNWTPLTK